MVGLGCVATAIWLAPAPLVLEASRGGPPAFYTSGRCVDLRSAGPYLLHKAPGCVDGDAVGGGFAAAHRMVIYIKRGFV